MRWNVRWWQPICCWMGWKRDWRSLWRRVCRLGLQHRLCGHPGVIKKGHRRNGAPCHLVIRSAGHGARTGSACLIVDRLAGGCHVPRRTPDHILQFIQFDEIVGLTPQFVSNHRGLAAHS